jgi:hypothetical protein
LNCRRGDDLKDGCYGCGDLDHFIAHYPKKNKHSSDKYDSSKCKDKRKHTFGKHKPKGGFNEESFKKKYLKKVKAQECAFLTSLSDLDNNLNDDRSSSPSSDDESERRREDKLTGLCFIADSIHGGFCTMAMDDAVKPSKHVVLSDDNTTNVKPTIDALVAELDIMVDTLFS